MKKMLDTLIVLWYISHQIETIAHRPIQSSTYDSGGKAESRNMKDRLVFSFVGQNGHLTRETAWKLCEVMEEASRSEKPIGASAPREAERVGLFQFQRGTAFRAGRGDNSRPAKRPLGLRRKG